MEYIGDEVSPAPRLRDAQVENPEEVFDYLIQFTATAWQKANLVHADLSDYNILWHEGKAVVIDVGQGVVQSHPKSEEFLVRDVKQLVRWANHNGIEIELADALYDVLEMNLDEEE
jgi:RIO kinase 1